MNKRWKIVGINFDHFHMGDLLRMAHEHPQADIVALCDAEPTRMVEAAANFGIPAERCYTSVAQCLTENEADLVICCPAAARHAEWYALVAPFIGPGKAVLMEKPFAASLEEARQMMALEEQTGGLLVINWPLCWVPSHVTAHRLVREGLIGQLTEVHHYGGNRGPLWHGADKIELEPTAERKAASWFYKASEGGGSLLDYLGYGTTLGTWFLGNAIPEEVTAVWHGTPGLEVDEHCITVARYAFGLSKFETRWGTFTDPWTHQPQPKCGFVLKGTEGTIASYDYEPSLRVQTRSHPEVREVPVDVLAAPHANPIQHILHCLATGEPLIGPLQPAVSWIGQRIVDTAFRSAQEKRTLPLLG
jgi:predicted dehydrogenase